MTGLWQQVRDQAAHCAWAAATLAPVLLWPSWWAGAIAGLILAAPRELFDQGPFRIGWSRALDFAGFALGGALIGGLFA